MREIKFRAWDGEDMLTNLDRVPLEALRVGAIETPDGESIISCVYMQLTGLKDKNGKDIYEGDICIFLIGITQERHIEINGSLDSTYCEIKWIRSAWGFEHLYPDLCHEDDREAKSFYVDPFEGDDWDTKGYFTVIGNIYEHPEFIAGCVPEKGD